MDSSLKLNGQTDVWTYVSHYSAPIRSLLEDESISEICIDTYQSIFVERGGCLQAVQLTFSSERALYQLIKQIGLALGQTVDVDEAPILDARLADGTRIHAVLAPLSSRGHSCSIRKFRASVSTLDELVDQRMLTSEDAKVLTRAIAQGDNLVVCGSTGAGKTTLLKAMAGQIPASERVIVIEDTREMTLSHPSWLSREVARRGGSNRQAITMSQMIISALRERPDRLLVGELRTADAAHALMSAMNTGHRGTMTTLHANSCTDALFRLDTLLAASAANLPFEFIQSQIRRNIDCVVAVARTQDGQRKVSQIMKVSDSF